MTQRSSRRQKILDYISDFTDRHGYTPTHDEIRRGCGIRSVSSVQYHLEALEREGRIRRNPRISRGIQLPERTGGEVKEVPLLGIIAAGEPIPVPGSESWATVPDDMFEIPPDLLGSNKSIYALQVKGTSMLDALIDDGDVVIMEPAQAAEDGEIVAVWLRSQQEVTLKRIYREQDRIRLQPANPLMSPIFVSPEDVEIQGKLLAVIRKVGR